MSTNHCQLIIVNCELFTMSVRLLRWGPLIGGSLLVALGVLLLIDQAHALPAIVWQYWPVVLIAWGLWKWLQQLRAREDRWAGPDYGTGLYVIRRRRRQASGWLPGLFLILLGGFLLWTTLDPLSGFTFRADRTNRARRVSSVARVPPAAAHRFLRHVVRLALIRSLLTRCR